MATLLLFVLLIAALCDYKTSRIPNTVIISGALSAMAYCLVNKRYDRLWQGLAVAFTIFIILYVFFVIGILGAGDIKLLMMMALYLDAINLLLILFISCTCAVIVREIGFIRIGEKYHIDRIKLSVPIFFGYGLWYLFSIFVVYKAL